MTRLSTLPSTREQAHHALLLLGAPAAVRLVVDVHAALFDGDLSVPALTALLRTEQHTHPPHNPPPSDPPRTDPPPSGSPRSDPPRDLGVVVGGDGGQTVLKGLSGHHYSKIAGVGDDPARPDGPGTGWSGDERGRGGGAGVRPYLICPGLGLDLVAVRGVVTLSSWGVAARICTPAAARADALAMVVRIAEFVSIRPGASPAGLLRQLAGVVPGGLESFDPLRPAALADAARAALADPGLVEAVAAEEPARAAAASRAEELTERQRLFGMPAVPYQRGRA